MSETAEPGSSAPGPPPLRGDTPHPGQAFSWPSPQQSLLVALTTTALVTIVSRLAPDDWANTAVGVVFIGATWVMVLRGDTQKVRAYGLSLAGLTEPEPLEPRRLAVAFARALGLAALMAAIFFPPFWYGYKLMWTQGAPFVWRLPPDFASRAMGQLLVIALPEEAFFRGFLQSALDGAWNKRWRVLGAEVGPGWLVAAVIFAVGHVLTIPNPARLGVLFPALVFGWMRARTGGIGAAVIFHAMCNLVSATLGSAYGVHG